LVSIPLCVDSFLLLSYFFLFVSSLTRLCALFLYREKKYYNDFNHCAYADIIALYIFYSLMLCWLLFLSYEENNYSWIDALTHYFLDC
jgi:hypothetical protein